MPTDTIYGIVANAHDEKAVERLYELKGRRPDKPLIILISSLLQLESFGIILNEEINEVLNTYWPGPVSIILPTQSDKHEYLHRGQRSLAFRMPAKKELLQLIEASGPLVAPSANPEGLPPATSIEEAKRYFPKGVDFFADRGRVRGNPSKLIKVTDGDIEILRG